MADADADAPTHAEPCPCGSGATFGGCCGPLLAGAAAPTAEALMRSRFTAFAVGDEAHLLRTWHADERPRSVRFVPGQRWTRLEVLATVGGDLLDTEGAVEFRAHHERDGRAGVLQELSRFVRDEQHRWVYVGPLEADLR